MPRRPASLAVALLVGLTVCGKESPRPPGPATVSRPTPFDTALADAVVSRMQILPADNPWHADIRDWPRHPNSAAIVASVGAGKPLRMNSDMNYVLVPADQPRVPFDLNVYPDEGDAGPFPIPANLPIEGWPAHYAKPEGGTTVTLDELQRDSMNAGGDRHAIVVDPARRVAYEFFSMRKSDAGWQGYAVKFDLATNALRPAGLTSADAAGLPIFPAIVRHDELSRGVIDHALRVTVRRSRRAYVAPATHFASSLTDPSLPRMGERLRLRKDFDTRGFTPAARVVLAALKRHGMFVADNGIEWAVSVAPDPRIAPMHDEFRRVKGSDFEVVVAPRE